MPHNVKVTIIQTDIKWDSIGDNIKSADTLLAGAPQSDVYVLPEMWATGFNVKPDDSMFGDEPLEWMKHTAEKRQCAICGSLAVKTTGGTLHNRLYFVLPDGSYYFYDKHHLFNYGGENKHFTPGNKRVVAEYKGVRFLLLTCYDLRFPVWSRYRDDYDAIILTANWPASRQEVWNILIKARAIENQCYVIGANRTGQDPTCNYIGGSAIIDAKGRVMEQANGTGEQAVTADLNPGMLYEFRKKFPVLNDRDILT